MSEMPRLYGRQDQTNHSPKHRPHSDIGQRYSHRIIRNTLRRQGVLSSHWSTNGEAPGEAIRSWVTLRTKQEILKVIIQVHMRILLRKHPGMATRNLVS